MSLLRHRAPWLILVLALSAPTLRLAAETPRFQEVTGHQFGERITLHHQMVRYVEALAEASDRVSVVYQGESWEGRKLPLVIVTSPANHARLEEIQEDAQRLADPRRTSGSEAGALAAGHPIILWMGGSIHGNELSGSEGLLKLLDRLASADDPDTLRALDDAVVLIDPMLNPDGRDAFAQANQRMAGRLPNPKRDDWGNSYTGWEAIGFRTGHYFFDTNRDWFAHTQAETRARAATLRAWRPQVVVDAHEMGSDAEFYFDPAAEPFGPFFPSFARAGFELFGNAYAQAFDSAGFEYMTRERYNFFYPGYTTSWGSYQGAVGMLYEQGSTRGLAIERSEDWVRTLAEALEQQYTAAWTAVATAVENRQQLLADYHEAHRLEIEDGKSGTRRYLLPPESDPAMVRELGALLARNGIEVSALTEAVELSGVLDRSGTAVGKRSFPAGTLVVEAAQPRNRLLRALLSPEVPIDPAFLAEARKRVERDQNPRFYDITAWSLPMLFDVGSYGSSEGRPLPTAAWSADSEAPGPARARAGYAYLLDGRQAASMAALHHLRANGVKASVLLQDSRVAGEPVANGTVIVRVAQNDDGVHDAVAAAAEHFRVAVRAVDSGLAEGSLPSLGSGETFAVRPSTIAILSGHPVHGYSFGWSWYTLDQQYEIPTTILRSRDLAGTPLDRFDVIVIPDLFTADGMAAMLGQGGIDRLTRWVRDGGTLVALGEAVELVRRKMGLTALRSFYPDPPKEGEKATPADEVPQPFRVPGAILQVRLDGDSFLAAGYPRDEDGGSSLPALVASAQVLLAPEGPPESRQRVAGRFAQTDESRVQRLSGHLWPESAERLAGAVFAYDERIGRGRVIAFAEDLNFRAYWRGANRLFLNAVVLGPSAP